MLNVCHYFKITILFKIVIDLARVRWIKKIKIATLTATKEMAFKFLQDTCLKGHRFDPVLSWNYCFIL